MASQEPVRKYSGLITAQVAVLVTSTQVFDDARTNTAEEEASPPIVTKPTTTLGRRTLTNLDAANPIFLGPTAGVTSANGHRVAAGGSFDCTGPGGVVYLGALFAIATGGTVNVSTWEH